MKKEALWDRIFGRPAFLNEPPYKNRIWILNVLIALLLLAIATTVQSLILTPVQTVYMLKTIDMERVSAYVSEGLSGISKVMNEVISLMKNMPSWIMLLMLFLFFTITLAVYVFRVKIEKGTPQSLGLYKKGAVKQYLIGLIAGTAIFGSAVLLCVLTGGLRFETPVLPDLKSWLLIVLFFLGYLVQGMAEEILCRGFLMTAIARRNNRLTAVLVNSVFFAFLHLFNPGVSLPALFNLVLYGVFSSIVVFKTGNLWAAAAIHSAWNFAQGNLFGITVSGMWAGNSVFHAEMTEKVFLNGGEFGMEGGLCVTLVLLVCTALAAIWNPPKKPEPGGNDNAVLQ